MYLSKIAKKGSRQTNIKLTYKTITTEKTIYVEFDAKQLVSNIFVTLRQQYKNNDINTDSRDKINNNSKIVAAGLNFLGKRNFLNNITATQQQQQRKQLQRQSQ